MISHDEALKAVKVAAESANAILSVVWVPVSGSRSELELKMNADLSQLGVVAVVVRKAIFDNANEVLNDLVRLLEDNRKLIERALLAQKSPELRCVIALLSRSELNMPQLGSPVVLPQWFPVRAGQTIDVAIRDLTWKATAGFESDCLRMIELCEELYDLERTLCARLKSMNSRDHASSNRLIEIFRTVDRSFKGMKESIALAELAQQETVNPSQFRPTLANQRSLVARLTAASLGTSIDKSASLSSAIVDGFGLSNLTAVPYESFLAVLARSHPFRKDAPERFARNLSVSIAASVQLITARAHAGDYAEYPTQTLRGLSFDLRSSLRASSQQMANLGHA